MAGDHADTSLAELEPAPVDGVQVSYTQFGVRMPDNTVLWAPLYLRVASQYITCSETSHTEDGLPLHDVDLAAVEREQRTSTPGPASAKLHEQLDALADAAYMPREEYRERVFVVQRELSLSVPERPSQETAAVDLPAGLV